ILTGNNTYGGVTTISAGTLQIGNGGTSGSLGSNSVTNNAALVFNRSDSITVANAISGTGSVTQTGTGTLTLDNANGYSGGTTAAAGTLALLNGADMSNTSLMTVNGGATFDISGHTGSAAINALAGGGTVQLGGNGLAIINASTEFSGAIAGTGGVEIGSGTQ